MILHFQKNQPPGLVEELRQMTAQNHLLVQLRAPVHPPIVHR